MDASSVFEPFRLNALTLKNRVIKSATYEGMCEHNAPSSRLISWHRKLAAGDVAMNTLAYCAVNNEGATFADQIVMTEAAIPSLQEFTSAIHQEDGKISAQLAHCGFFTKNKTLRSAPVSPSKNFNNLGVFSGIPFGREMSSEDIQRTVEDFSKAAVIAKKSGFDAVEIHSGHGYLLSQFLSPRFNRRKDQYGGVIENRVRFPLEVISAVREAVGPHFPILVKMNLEDGFKRGLTIKESVEVARSYEQAGADALVLSGGCASVNAFYLLRGDIPLRQMIAVEKNWMQKIAVSLFGPFVVRKIAFKPTFFLEMAKQVRSAVNIPLVYVGGITSLDDMTKVMDEGFDLIALGRPLIHDSNFVRKLQSGETRSTGCIYCNQCIPEIDRNGVRCVLN